MNRRFFIFRPAIIKCKEFNAFRKQCTISKSFKGEINIQPFIDTNIHVDSDDTSITIEFSKNFPIFPKDTA